MLIMASQTLVSNLTEAYHLRFSRKCRVEGEKIIVGQKRLDQKEQKAVHMG